MKDNAIDSSTGRGRFCIKHLREDLMLLSKREFADAALDLRLEAAYLQRLDHAHILPLRGLPVDDSQLVHESEQYDDDDNSRNQHDGYFLVLDRLQDTLDRVLDQWSTVNEQQPQLLPDTLQRTRLSYAWQLASAVAYLHQMGILFRDLKPQNIGITINGRLQLFDFGLCRERPATKKDDDHSDSDEMFVMSGVGTRRYMAPEVVNRSQYNCKADVYSWSMVVWQMFSLSKPYPLYSMEDHGKFVCQEGERPPPLEENLFTEALNAILQESWCESVKDRLAMSDVQDRLAELLESPRVHPALESSSSNTTQPLVTVEGIELLSEDLADFCIQRRRLDTASTILDSNTSTTARSRNGLVTATEAMNCFSLDFFTVPLFEANGMMDTTDSSELLSFECNYYQRPASHAA
jgi:serine/threonine protein kinase